jgi:hypothetical protein
MGNSAIAEAAAPEARGQPVAVSAAHRHCRWDNRARG